MSLMRHFFVVIILALTHLPLAMAESVPYPLDRPALDLYLLDGQRHTFTLADLQRLPQSRIRLKDAQGVAHLWLGVSLADLLASVSGAEKGNALHARALNQYSIFIPRLDIERYQPLIAYRRDDQLMAIRDFGPLHLIYPFDDYPELRQQLFYNRAIWQLSEIHLE